MTVYEMEGFLRGKCLPRDMKVNESNAQYLVRKFSELQSQNAELAVQLTNAESKCRELAAESAHARGRHVFIRALAVSILEHSGGRMDWRGAMEDATELLQTVDSVYAKTPATDAFLAEVRTSARNDFIGRIEWIIRNECNPDKTEAIINELQNFSEELKLEAAQ